MFEREARGEGTTCGVAEVQQWPPVRIHLTDNVLEIPTGIVRRAKCTAWSIGKPMPALVPCDNVPATEIEPSGKRCVAPAVFAQPMRNERCALGIRNRPMVQVQARAIAGMDLIEHAFQMGSFLT
jgi:hypothetical protein